ncbi:hypothetical protein DYB28_006407 [Aphanomyces astaci]|uniref:PB1 domain-containing protein n=1 Tax=Aphanomyces astaci TaxID=112090 RepID=A0A9X8H944_APHAT|nr:hypothetical protein DYB28_006407 [Aphanomyces astaci]
MPSNNQTSHHPQHFHTLHHEDLEAGHRHPTTSQEASKAVQDYLDLVRVEIGDQDELYRQFMDGLQSFLYVLQSTFENGRSLGLRLNGRVEVPEKYRRMLEMFQGRPSLVAGFNIFLPDMYRNYDLTPPRTSSFGPFAKQPVATPPPAPTSTAAPTARTSSKQPLIWSTSSLAPHCMTTTAEYVESLHSPKSRPSFSFGKPATQSSSTVVAESPFMDAAPQAPTKSSHEQKLFGQQGYTPPQLPPKGRPTQVAAVPRAMPAKLGDFGTFSLPLAATASTPSSSTGLNFISSNTHKTGLSFSSIKPLPGFGKPAAVTTPSSHAFVRAATTTPAAVTPQAAPPSSDWLVSFNSPTPGKTTPELTSPCYELNVPGSAPSSSFGCHHPTKVHMPWTFTPATTAPAAVSSLATTDSFVRMVHQRFHANPAKLSTFQTLLSQLQRHYCTQSHLLMQLYATFGHQANDDLLGRVATFLQLSCSHHSNSQSKQTSNSWPTRCAHVMDGSDVVPLMAFNSTTTTLAQSPRGLFHRPSNDATQPSSPFSTHANQPSNTSDERVVKLGFQAHFHRIRVRATSFTLADLEALFHHKLALTPGSFTIKYKDNDGDYVHVDTVADFNEAMHLAETTKRFRFDALPVQPTTEAAVASPEPSLVEDICVSNQYDEAVVGDEEVDVHEEPVDDASQGDWRHTPEPDTDSEQPAAVVVPDEELEVPTTEASALTAEHALKWAAQLAVVQEVIPTASGQDVVRKLEAAKGNLQVVVNQLVDM